MELDNSKVFFKRLYKSDNLLITYHTSGGQHISMDYDCHQILIWKTTTIFFNNVTGERLHLNLNSDFWLENPNISSELEDNADINEKDIISKIHKILNNKAFI